MKNPPLVIISVLAFASATRAAPFFEENIVWEKNEDDMLTYHVPTIFVSRNDTVLVAADARFDEYGDFGPHHIVMKRSTDRGRTFSSNHYIARSVNKEIFLMPNFIQPRNSNRILFIYSQKMPGRIHHESFVWLTESADDGVTWKNRRRIDSVLVAADRDLQEAIREDRAGTQFASENPSLYGRNAFFSGPGVAIQLRANHPVAANRIIVPVLGMQVRNAPDIQRGHGDLVLMSDDGGDTWFSRSVPIGNYVNSEPSIVELDDGTLLINRCISSCSDMARRHNSCRAAEKKTVSSQCCVG